MTRVETNSPRVHAPEYIWYGITGFCCLISPKEVGKIEGLILPGVVLKAREARFTGKRFPAKAPDLPCSQGFNTWSIII